MTDIWWEEPRLPIAVTPAITLTIHAYQLHRPGVALPVWRSTAWQAIRGKCPQ